MKLKYFTLSFLFLLMNFSVSAQTESEVNKDSLNIEKELLYNASWKLAKMEPAFSNDVSVTMSFDKATKQLRVVKQVKLAPVLEGTNLVTKKKETIDFYQWAYTVLETKYDGDDVSEVIYDYSGIELKTEGYAFKIESLDDGNLVLKVVKAPRAIFGNTIFDVKKIYFTK